MSNETDGDIYGALKRKNRLLANALSAARQELASLHEELKLLNQPPLSFGMVVETHAVDRKVDVWVAGRKTRANIAPKILASQLYPGCEVLLNEHLVVVEVATIPKSAEVVLVRESYPDHTIRVTIRPDEEQILMLTPELFNQVRSGDSVKADLKAKIAFAKLDRAEVSPLLLLEPPSVNYREIGGLSAQIEHLRDAIELPILRPDLYRRLHLLPPRGVLLYGPPGCGKTMIAKALAHHLGKALPRLKGEGLKAYFLNIKGPQLLNKYVGESERQIRSVFAEARELAQAGNIVVIFFDEMESLFRVRGAGKSSDVETTIVPQLLSEIDGVESLDNVLIVGATNREDMLDPAILRPGRLDLKIEISRPDRQGVIEIARLYLEDDLPYSSRWASPKPDKAAEYLASQIYDSKLAQDSVEIDGIKLSLADLVSGAVISNIVARAKKLAIKATRMHSLESSSENEAATSSPTKPELTIEPDHILTAIAQEWEETKGVLRQSKTAWQQNAGIKDIRE